MSASAVSIAVALVGVVGTIAVALIARRGQRQITEAAALATTNAAILGAVTDTVAELRRQRDEALTEAKRLRTENQRLRRQQRDKGK